ncbi:hypothetical protein SAMN05216268_105136 [Streptomyces yunnanensis]|uniref:Uncharacterized protein n=1 Tax=Streptomyces yunnanensis TaxID=156453 RepID=A0A9X8MRW6_9ACTN|nr:hypothetical protein SAMN05216268_105136 [Streptomyces yunnanensis]
MTQLQGLSPIAPYGTRPVAYPAKTFLRRNVGGGDALKRRGGTDAHVSCAPGAYGSRTAVRPVRAPPPALAPRSP